MKFMVCGSGDAVGIPGLFCRCPVCVSARENGGKERRSRTGYLLGDAVKFDFGPDTAMQARELGFDLTKLRRIFITHSHSDHFGAEELWNQTLGVSAPEQIVTLYGNTEVLKQLAPYRNFGITLQTQLLRSGETVSFDGIRVTAIATDHIPTEECLMYLIETPGKNVLIATDSDRFPESAFALLKNRRVDHIFIDATWGVEHREHQGHMGLPAIREIVARLRRQNTLTPESHIWAVHISHLAAPLPCTKFPAALDDNPCMEWSYDGLTVDLV